MAEKQAIGNIFEEEERQLIERAKAENVEAWQARFKAKQATQNPAIEEACQPPEEEEEADE